MSPHPTEVGLVHWICFGQQNVAGSDRVPDLNLSARCSLRPHCHEVSMSHLAHGSMEKEQHVRQSWPRPIAWIQAQSASADLW